MSDETGKMHCPSCGADWFSASAAQLIERGHRCLRCDGALVLADDAGDEDGAEAAPPENRAR